MIGIRRFHFFRSRSCDWIEVAAWKNNKIRATYAVRPRVGQKTDAQLNTPPRRVTPISSFFIPPPAWNPPLAFYRVRWRYCSGMNVQVHCVRNVQRVLLSTFQVKLYLQDWFHWIWLGSLHYLDTKRSIGASKFGYPQTVLYVRK